MSVFTQKLRTFAVVAVGAVALLMGSCLVSQTGSKVPLGAPADEATHAPELIGTWEWEMAGNSGMLIFRPDGVMITIFVDEYGDLRDKALSWKTDGSVLFRGWRADYSADEVWGDYVISENTLRIKDVTRGRTDEYKLKTRDVEYDLKNFKIIRE